MILKKLLIAFGALAAFILLVAGVGILMIDSIACKIVETQSAVALKVPTKLHDATIKFSGRATLGKFEIGNPAPFTEPRAVTFEKFEVALQPRELFHEAIHVDEMNIVRPELTLEFTGAKNNLSALLDNISAGQPKDKPAPAPSGGKKFLVRKIRIQDAVVRFKSDLLSGGARSVALPAMEIENVGTAEGGVSMGEILRVVLQTLGASALKAGEGLLPADALNSLRGDLEGKLREAPAKAMEELEKKAGEILPSELEKKLKGTLEKKAD